MKKILFLCLGLMFYSCNDYLEVMPDATLDIKIDSEDKIAELLTAAYPKASYFAFLEPRTDNFVERTQGERLLLNESMYYWRDYDQEDLDHPLFYWNACYKGIAQVNNALEHLKKYPQKTDRIKALYGEAFLLRAYLHFMLINIWAEPYNTATSATDPAIPYMGKPEKNALPKYERSNVKDVYDAIEKDLLFGLELVNDQYYKIPKYHFNKEAAYAFASRFYLYKGDWDKVIAYSDYVVGANPTKKLRNYFTYNINIKSPAEYTRLYNSTEEPVNLLLAATESRLKRNMSIEKFGFESKGILDKKFQEFEKFGNSGTRPRDIYVTNVLLKADEVVLNRAEAYAMKRNYRKATEDLNYVAGSDRPISNLYDIDKVIKAYPTAVEEYTPFYPLTTYQASAIRLISEWRKRLYVYEGLRWFDIRRFHLSINRWKKGNEQNPEHLLRKNDKRTLLQIPAQAISTGLQPNPR